jgi:hypothetical protein
MSAVELFLGTENAKIPEKLKTLHPQHNASLSRQFDALCPGTSWGEGEGGADSN